jgi:hypothetical protein
VILSKGPLMKAQMHIVITVVASCLTLFVFAPNKATAADPAALRHFVEMGKIPPGIAKQIEAMGTAEVLAIIANSDIRETARNMREEAGIRNDNSHIIAEKAKQYGLRKKKILSGLAQPDFAVLHDYETLPVLHLEVNERALAVLMTMPEVSYIAENRKVIPHLSESLPLIRVPEAQGAGASGAGTSVAVLDTGVDFLESAFGDCSGGPGTAGCKVAYVQDFTPVDDGSLDDDGHGTNVCGIVLGVAPDTDIIGLDVFRTDGYAYYNDILDALDWVLSNKAVYNIVAVNMSFGNDASTTPCDSDGLAAAITDMKAAGIAASISSGNDGYTDSLSAPACAPDAISVGAVYDGGPYVFLTLCPGDTKAADTVTCFSNSASFLTLLAPGAEITAAGWIMAGTSQAAPHVAGAVAALKGNDGTLTVDQIIASLSGSGAAVLDTRNGVTKPRIDVYAALDVTSPYITLSPSPVTFRASEGGVNPADRSLNITNTGFGTLDWSASDDASWLNLSPLSGSGDGSATLSVDTTGLTIGTYIATITVTSTNALNSPQTVTVTLEIVDPAQFEDFETGGLAKMQWTTGGDGQWFAQSSVVHSGTYSLQSPDLSPPGSSYIETTLNICSEGYVYFWLKTSTEPQWNNLKFHIDGLNEGKWDGWHGATNWTEAQSEHLVQPGPHTFKWTYFKTISDSGGGDTVWLDDIVFPEFSFNPPIRVVDQYYNTIQSAYDAAADGGTIQLQSIDYYVNLTLAKSGTYTLQGGYDCNFAGSVEPAVLYGLITISDGTVIFDNVVIQ